MASFKPSISLNTDSTRCPSGKVHIIMGLMFAGKTTALLRRIKYEGDSRRNMVMTNLNKDNSYTIDSVVIHDRAKFSCWDLPDLSSF
ncbi:hypothetical protein ACLB2K_007605 [Fragaria x ananassa]